MVKARSKLIRLIREDPTLADWWIEQEAKVAKSHRPGRPRLRVHGNASASARPYAELKAAALAHRDLFDDAEASSGGSAESDSFDCHCTD